jgi:TetR/AcrR family transcriptional regulator, regulator of cefoperazone and chloramphenicol sensitivity
MAVEDFVPKTPRERILAATVEMIEKEGQARLTTRTIAAAAGVNVAAINYYFQNKDALVEAAIAASWAHAAEHLRAFLIAEPWEPRPAVEGIAAFLFEGGFRFPAVMKANLFDGEGSIRANIAAAIAKLSADLTARLKDYSKQPADDKLRARVDIFFSALLFPPIASSCMPWYGDEKARSEYLQVLVDDLLLHVAL